MGDAPAARGRDARAVPGELVLAYRLEESIPLDVAASYRHVERWAVSVLLDRGVPGDDRVEIGDVQLLVLTLEPGMEIGQLADRVSGTWVDIETVAHAPRSQDDLGEDAGGLRRIVLLDRVWLDPAHRGHGLGPIVAAAAIGRLGRGCQLVACYPAPFETNSRHPEDRAGAIEALGRVWSKVGFRHWRDGVWMLDLSTHDMHATLLELLAARS